ncbi:MAG TPA: hypothetical protein VF487_12425 [Chitinophagaceae bacterium]
MPNLIGQTNDLNTPGVYGENPDFVGVKGVSKTNTGMEGKSEKSFGVQGSSIESCGIVGTSEEWEGVYGESKSSIGVHGKSNKGIGIAGESTDSVGVFGKSARGTGIHGESLAGAGVLGKSNDWEGVHGESVKSTGVAGVSESWFGVYGESKDIHYSQLLAKTVDIDIARHKSDTIVESRISHLRRTDQKGIGVGVVGKSDTGRGVLGSSQSNTAVEGNSVSGAGVWGSSVGGEGVHAETNSPRVAAIAAFNRNPNGVGAAIYAMKEGNVGHAGFFQGNVHITDSLTVEKDMCCKGADFAEDFDVLDAVDVEPGTVMVLTDGGNLTNCSKAYDKRVAGVISGAGTFRPGIILDKQNTDEPRVPIALLGKVYCKVDASFGAIEAGDLLTTSSVPGHAMKAIDPLSAFGAIIGKALKPLADGKGIIPVLVSLQ